MYWGEKGKAGQGRGRMGGAPRKREKEGRTDAGPVCWRVSGEEAQESLGLSFHSRSGQGATETQIWMLPP